MYLVCTGTGMYVCCKRVHNHFIDELHQLWIFCWIMFIMFAVAKLCSSVCPGISFDKEKYNITWETEDFVETHIYRLCVILIICYPACESLPPLCRLLSCLKFRAIFLRSVYFFFFVILFSSCSEWWAWWWWLPPLSPSWRWPWSPSWVCATTTPNDIYRWKLKIASSCFSFYFCFMSCDACL